MFVEVKAEIRARLVHRLLPVDAAVNGVCGMARPDRKHLGRAASRSKQHHALMQSRESLHHCAGQRGLARTGRTAQYHGHPVVPVNQETAECADGCGLLCRRRKTEGLKYLICKFVCNHSNCKLTKNLLYYRWLCKFLTA